jgi:hypothetical protein
LTVKAGKRLEVSRHLSRFTKTVAVRWIEMGTETDQQSFWVLASLAAQLQAHDRGMLLRRRPMIGTTRQQSKLDWPPKIRVANWLQFFFNCSTSRQESYQSGQATIHPDGGGRVSAVKNSRKFPFNGGFRGWHGSR